MASDTGVKALLPEEEQQPQQSLDEDPMVHGTVT